MVETMRIEIEEAVKDLTGLGLASASKKMTAFDKANEKTQKRLNDMSRVKWKVVLEAVDKITSVVTKIGSSVKGFAGRSWNVTIGVIDKVTAPVKTMISAVGKLLSLGTVATSVLGGMTVVDMLDASTGQNTVERQLETVLANVSDAEDAMDRLKVKASALQQDTMYGDETFLAGAAELATYLSDVEALEKAMDVLKDYAAGMSGGAELSIEEMTNYATQLGKALNGPDAAFDGLTKKGFAFSEAQKEILQSDLTSDMEKVAVLAEVIGESWDGLAEAFASTPTARITQFKNAWGDMKEVVGDKLFPSVGSFFQMLTAKIPFVQNLLEKAADWAGKKFEENIPALEKWFDEGVARIEKLSARMEAVFGSDRFQNASFLGKVKIAWDQIIAQPFSDWWDSSGKVWFTKKMAGVGEGIGAGLSAGLAGIFGLDTKSTREDGKSIGTAFADGFVKGFDADRVWNAVLKWGESHKGIVAAAGGVVGSHLVTGIAESIQGLMSAWSTITSIVSAVGKLNAAIAVAAIAVAAIGGVIYALVELDKKRNVETREVERMIKAHKELIEEYNRSVEAIDAEQESTEYLIDQYTKLTEKESRSREEKAQLLAVTEKLNQLMPELGLQYDYYTDKVNGSAEAVRNLAKAEYMRKMMAQDQELIISLTEQNYQYSEKATSLRSDISDLEKREKELLTTIQQTDSLKESSRAGLEVAKVQGELKDKRAALTSLQADWAVSSRELDNAATRYAEKQEAYNEAWNAYSESGSAGSVSSALEDSSGSPDPSADLSPGSYVGHAWGGILQSPHMAMVAEDGAEAIIPLSPSKRQRGLDLWEDAGQRMGVKPYADGGIAGDTVPVTTTTYEGATSNQFDIHVEVSPEFVIEARDAGFDGDSLVEVIRAHIREMADDIGDELADRLARVFANMPVKGVA